MLALVIPCFNEAGRLDAGALAAWLDGGLGRRLVLVDDGSADRTWEILLGLERERPGRVRALRLAVNRGKGEAVRRGLLTALDWGADAVGYWDADLAAPLADAGRMASLLHRDPALGLVHGRREAAARTPLRRLLSGGFLLVSALAAPTGLRDPQCGAKLLRAPAAAAIAGRPFRTRWLFDLELVWRLRRRGWRCSALALPGWRDRPGSRFLPRSLRGVPSWLAGLLRELAAAARAAHRSG